MTFTEVIQFITAMGVLGTGLGTLRNGRKTDAVKGAVNSTAQKQNARVEQLTASLTASGVTVPEHPDTDTTDETGNH